MTIAIYRSGFNIYVTKLTVAVGYDRPGDQPVYEASEMLASCS